MILCLEFLHISSFKLPIYKYFKCINKKRIYPQWILRIFISNKQKAKVDIIKLFSF